ncbi:MAG: carbon-nitrogen hydrolase family protein [Deltaproteobacteria bacterium]|nr:carbon-nitrogen hydrolase family protein [Deltaproteobacteria bacterium]
MIDSFTLALAQIQVGLVKEDNLAAAERLIREAAAKGIALAILPEMFNCPYEDKYIGPFAEEIPQGQTSRFLSHLAAELGIYLVGGSIPEKSDGPKPYNTATLWDPAGKLLLKYRKVHLFDVDIPLGITRTESDTISAGDRFGLVQTELGTIGLAVCFDLRFPEVFRALALGGAELIVLPGAFNTTTGPVHWELILRARAVENTVYMAACGGAPSPSVDYPAWGRSMLVDPFGQVKASAGREEEIVYGLFDRQRLSRVRQALPFLNQRRPEVYARGLD